MASKLAPNVKKRGKYYSARCERAGCEYVTRGWMTEKRALAVLDRHHGGTGDPIHPPTFPQCEGESP